MDICETLLYEGDAPYAFVTCSQKDWETALPLLTRLADQGLRLWCDPDLNDDVDRWEVVASHLRGAAVFLAFLSVDTVASDALRMEFDLVLEERMSCVMVRLEEVDLPLLMQLYMTTRINAYQLSRQEVLDGLLHAAELEPCRDRPEEEPDGMPEETPEDRNGAPEETPEEPPENRNGAQEEPDEAPEVLESPAPAPQPPAPTHLILLRRSTGERIPIRQKEFHIGRSPLDNDYSILENTWVSRHHARIRQENRIWQIEDLGSLNRSFLNAQEIPPHTWIPLQDRDELNLGTELFQVRIEPDEA